MWKLSGSRGELEIEGVRFRLDAAKPHLGHLASVSNGCFLQLQPADARAGQGLELSEVYVRGADLVAAYKPLPAQQLQPHVYWRGKRSPAHGAFGLEMIVSLQTSLLDSDAQTVVETGLPTGPVWRPVAANGSGAWQFSLCQQFPSALSARDATVLSAKTPSVLLAQPCDIGYAYCEMVHPADFLESTVSLNRFLEPVIVSRLFQERLEKGVIRRARIAGWQIPRAANVAQVAQELFQQFAAEPPPLTT